MRNADAQMKIRLPSDAKAFIQAEAYEAASSQNSVIVRAIRAAMKAKGPASASTLPSRGSNIPQPENINEHAQQ
jgi:hypothetical protein